MLPRYRQGEQNKEGGTTDCINFHFEQSVSKRMHYNPYKM